MIISHKHKFIFIKTRKTAGTSVEVALSRYCGEDDVITPISPTDEELRQKSGGKGPQNYHAELCLPYLKDFLVQPHHIRKNIKRLRKKQLYYNHISAAKIRDRVGSEIWNSYYKFCFERNPWDKVISNYYWHKNTYGQDVTLDDYLNQRSLPINHKLYCIHGKSAVDFIGRFENLNDDLQRVCDHLGIDFDGHIPRAKAAIRPQKTFYRDVLNEQQKNKVSQLFKKEIQLLGYNY